MRPYLGVKNVGSRWVREGVRWAREGGEGDFVKYDQNLHFNAISAQNK